MPSITVHERVSVDICTRQPKCLAQEMREEQARLHLPFISRAVDGDRNRICHDSLLRLEIGTGRCRLDRSLGATWLAVQIRVMISWCPVAKFLVINAVHFGQLINALYLLQSAGNQRSRTSCKRPPCPSSIISLRSNGPHQ
jgi:hypothetical protein